MLGLRITHCSFRIMVEMSRTINSFLECHPFTGSWGLALERGRHNQKSVPGVSDGGKVEGLQGC